WWKPKFPMEVLDRECPRGLVRTGYWQIKPAFREHECFRFKLPLPQGFAIQIQPRLRRVEPSTGRVIRAAEGNIFRYNATRPAKADSAERKIHPARPHLTDQFLFQR